jgi:hypothetical protein
MIYIRTLVIEHKPENLIFFSGKLRSSILKQNKLLMSKIKFGMKLMVPDIVYIIQMGAGVIKFYPCLFSHLYTSCNGIR